MLGMQEEEDRESFISLLVLSWILIDYLVEVRWNASSVQQLRREKPSGRL